MRMDRTSDFLDQEYAIDTPENVTFAHEIAGIGNRFIAALVDTSLIFGALLVLNIIVLVGLNFLGDLETATTSTDEETVGWIGGLLIALYALINFLIFWGYYVLFEYLWNGQTPGKRLVKIRVLRTDGNPAGFVEIMIRNLVRIVDFLPSGYGVGLLVMFFNREARRLGDFAAGTLVIKERTNISLRSLAPSSLPMASSTADRAASVDETLLLRYAHIRRLTSQDYELIQETLNREQTGGVDSTVVVRLARSIATKLEVDPPERLKTKAFLQEVLRAYRQIEG
jgi:uncharacterized RDD family membrane protein YckC